ncbi:MAG: hypothetical protein JOZ25_11840 [Actinobacteria bacterium]|nr:hypothetical protein [Actinomycetota bacterium]
MKRQRKRAQDLRRAVDCLPRATREAMLEGLERSDIIVGAYTDGSGGVCPMLAAHRNGGRTSLASFARAWDRYTDAAAARRASGRELNTLRAMLEASLYYEPDESELARAAAEHRAVKERAAKRARRRRRRETGERDRSLELRSRPGWAWLRVFRRLDDWEAAVARAEETHPGASAPAPGLERVSELERV